MPRRTLNLKSQPSKRPNDGIKVDGKKPPRLMPGIMETHKAAK